VQTESGSKMQNHTASKPRSPPSSQKYLPVAGIYNVQRPFAELIYKVEAC